MNSNMRAERARRGMTASQVAKSIGVSANQIYRWENEEQEPGAVNIVKLARLYGVSPEYLLGIDYGQEVGA